MSQLSLDLSIKRIFARTKADFVGVAIKHSKDAKIQQHC